MNPSEFAELQSVKKELEVTNLTLNRVCFEKTRLKDVLKEWLSDYEGWLDDTLPNGVSQIDRIANKARNLLNEIV